MIDILCQFVESVGDIVYQFDIWGVVVFFIGGQYVDVYQCCVVVVLYCWFVFYWVVVDVDYQVGELQQMVFGLVIKQFNLVGEVREVILIYCFGGLIGVGDWNMVGFQ